MVFHVQWRAGLFLIAGFPGDLQTTQRTTDMSLQNRVFQPKAFQLTTAEILYRLPDYPGLLQSFVWQKLDSAPDFPLLREFLAFWDSNLDGSIHSVRVAGRDIIDPPSLRCIDREFTLH
jgi:uncharacterized protein Usg